MPKKPSDKSTRKFLDLTERGPIIRREYAMFDAKGEEIGRLRMTSRCVSYREKDQRVWYQIPYEDFLPYILANGMTFTDRVSRKPNDARTVICNRH